METPLEKTFNNEARDHLSCEIASYKAIRTALLQREKTHILKFLQPIKDTWPKKSVSIVTGLSSNAQRRPLINFMEASDAGPIFLKAIDGSCGTIVGNDLRKLQVGFPGTGIMRFV
ncbi:hypothetical protein SESBI_36597 [Sesbania bispinosa]|nr:hypothetical protein SESBI_36597 [Sesbania bispinosa]